MSRFIPAGLVAASVFFLSACSGGSGTTADSSSLPPPPPGTASTRFVNALGDASPLTASVTGSSDTLPNVAFATDSGLLNIPIGSYSVQVASTDGSAQVDISVPAVHVDTGYQTTLYAVGTVADQDAIGLPVEMPVDSGVGGSTMVTVVNASTSQAHAQVFIVPSNQGIGGTAPLTTLQSPVASVIEHPAFTSQALTVTSGAKRIVLVNGHDGGTIMFDTLGSANAPTFPDGGSIQIAIVEAPGAAPRPDGETIQLMIMDNNGGATRIVADGPH